MFREGVKENEATNLGFEGLKRKSYLLISHCSVLAISQTLESDQVDTILVFRLSSYLTFLNLNCLKMK